MSWSGVRRGACCNVVCMITPKSKGGTMNVVKRLVGAIGASVMSLCACLAFAQAPVDVPFFFPVAVGGPITKIIDGFAADFEKENPGIKLKPIYSGTYQDS